MATVRWTGREQVSANMGRYGTAVERACGEIADYYAPQLESHAKQHAPWTDRSGAARSGLRAQRVDFKGGVAIVIWHTMFYGKFLEISHAGRYRILFPTVLHFAAPVFKMVQGAFRR